MTDPPNREAPCEKTGQPCEWMSEEYFDDDGNESGWDLFCSDCYRFRDWTKEE